MKVSVAYALPHRQMLLTVVLTEGATVKEALERSGMLKQCPEIDLTTQKIGVFHKIVPLDAVLVDGDRVEIYRPITVDPKTVRRKTKGGDAGESGD